MIFIFTAILFFAAVFFSAFYAYMRYIDEHNHIWRKRSIAILIVGITAVTLVLIVVTVLIFKGYITITHL